MFTPAKTYEEVLADIDSIDVRQYAQTRNHLDGAVSRLSPYITRGVVSLPLVRERILARASAAEAEKFLQELAWREYFQNVWWAKGEAICTDLRFAREDWRHHELVQAIVEGATGIDVIDQGVAELYETGYMHNHLRLWVAALSCNLARAHWLPMGQWLYYHLADGDPASNFCSWQWVAGTSVNKRYTVNQSLINACANSAQTGTWLEIERDELGTMEIPDILRTTSPATFAQVYPSSDAIDVTAAPAVHLYHPWSLDPQWRAGEAGARILVIDPTWFDRLPVSSSVMDFIINQAKTVIPEIRVWVGAPDALPGLAQQPMYYPAHPTTATWPGAGDARELLFPEVTGYYPSFFKYWQAVQQHYSVDGSVLK